MSKFTKSVLAAGVLLTVLGGASQAWASCKNGVCVSGSDDGQLRTHVVYLSTQMSGMDVYNIILPGQPQQELHANTFTFPIRPGYTYTFSVQACRKGGFAQKSVCTSWAQFSHSVPNAG
jgi:hypothetical protein